MIRRRQTCRRLAVAALCGAALHLATPGASAQPRIAHADQGSVELITATGVVGNDGVVEGLRFRLLPGWHIYWRNPGDSGGPPTIKWSVPDGVERERVLVADAGAHFRRAVNQLWVSRRRGLTVHDSSACEPTWPCSILDCRCPLARVQGDLRVRPEHRRVDVAARRGGSPRRAGLGAPD